MPGPSTRSVHAVSHAADGSLQPPVQRSSTFCYPELPDGSPSRYIYGRYDSPTLDWAQDAYAKLEGAKHALFFASGLAAASTALHAMLPTGKLVLQDGVYGGTQALVQEAFPNVEATPLGDDLHVPEGTDLVWVEAITNPLLRVVDIQQLARNAHAVGAKLIVDATFAPPTLWQPLTLGADLVLHSGTKYLGGHSDLLAGTLATNDAELKARLWQTRRNLGNALDVDTTFLLIRGMKTLGLRLERQCSNAAKLAAAIPVPVHYPGLEHHPDHAVARQQFAYPGAMLTIDTGSKSGAQAFRRKLQLIAPAASLGGVESLACLPLETSHAYSSDDERLALGISDGLVRISCGIEDPDDLIADVLQALGQA